VARGRLGRELLSSKGDLITEELEENGASGAAVTPKDW